MKSFKSIREGNYAEPGVSEIDDVPEDPMSFVEIKPKKTKVVKEGIVDSAANARVRIFSSIDRKKKELYKNAVKEDIHEAVTVKKEKYSWGNMMTVHHGSDTSFPLHPEHQSAIKKLRPGMKTTFKDETNSTVHAHREDNTIHLTRPKTGSTLTSLPYHHFDTSEHAKPAAKKPAGEYDRKVTDHLKKKYNEDTEQMNELNKDTVYSYAAKAEKDLDKKHKELSSQIKTNNPQDANKTSSKIVKRYAGMGRAETRLNKEEAEQGVAEASNKTLKIYLQKVSSDSMKHKADPTKRSPEKANRSVAGFAKAQNRLEKNVNEEWTKTGKTGTHIASGQKTFEWAKVNNKGDRTGERHYRNASGKVMGEETLSELKKSTLGSYVKKAADSATMSAYGAGGESQRLAGEPVSKRPDTYGADRKVALKRLKGIGKATDRLTKEETVLETKGAPKGFHFTKDGKLKRGDANQDGNGGPMLRTDPLDKQRSKVPAVSEGIDFFKVWESIKPVEIVVEEEAVDPIILKREADILMALHIAAHKAK
jgi:hypothetical protein